MNKLRQELYDLICECGFLDPLTVAKSQELDEHIVKKQKTLISGNLKVSRT